MVRGVWALALLLVAQAKKLRGSWLEISVGSSTFSVTDYGAKGDGKSDDTKAIQAALDAAGAAGGGTVDFPPGSYLTTAFHFSGNNTVINLPVTARVVFDDDISKYEVLSKYDSLIEANGLSNIGIVGGGTFDGQGSKWWACGGKGCDPNCCSRPRMFHTNRTDHVLIMDCVFKNSPKMFISLWSNYVELSGISALAPPTSPNTDGVDVHGSPFYIHDVHFDTGDDDVSVGTGTGASDLLVENCYFGHGHGASLGSLGSNIEVRNVTFRNITFNNTGNGARIKTDTGAKNSSVKDVIWENIVLYNVRRSIQIEMFYHGSENKTTDFKISNITIRNLTAYGTHTDGGKRVTPGFFHCQESSPCKDIHLEDIRHVDSKEPFECYNAFGDYSNVSPKPCLGRSPGPSPGPVGCDVDGCFDRCASKYGGSIKTDAYYCAKGCAGMKNRRVVEKEKYCKYDARERTDECLSYCGSSVTSSDNTHMCEYGCGFWADLSAITELV